MKALFIDKQGIVRYNEFPEEPKPENFQYVDSEGDTILNRGPFNQALSQWRDALQAAKDSSVECADQDEAMNFALPKLREGYCILLDEVKDTIHPFPSDQYEVEVREVETGGRTVKNTDGTVYDYERWFTTLAYITPLKEHRKNLLIEMMKADEESGMYEGPSSRDQQNGQGESQEGKFNPYQFIASLVTTYQMSPEDWDLGPMSKKNWREINRRIDRHNESLKSVAISLKACFENYKTR